VGDVGGETGGVEKFMKSITANVFSVLSKPVIEDTLKV
jgi:hypothetical protein